MAYHPRIESSQYASFLTTRSRNSRLWFVNNSPLEKSILGYAAKYADRYGVKLYALAVEGNHIQAPAAFPLENRAHFMRDLNSSVARAVPRHTPEYDGGRFWARRYSSEFLPGAEDVEEYFFYTVLQPIKDGLVERLSDYPGYNCFNDAVKGIERPFKVVNWAEYYAAKRSNPRVPMKDYVETVFLKYERLPGYEHLSQAQYEKIMRDKLEQRRLAIVAERMNRGLCFVGTTALRKVKRGSLPKQSKTSDRMSHRPRVLSICNHRRAACRAWYFQIYYDFKDASCAYRSGDAEVIFPPGTYKPYCTGAPPIQG
ncbi:MAG: transposase [Oligoflexia bacterium]|nr:transposase [Oligoflexia bacterium]